MNNSIHSSLLAYCRRNLPDKPEPQISQLTRLSGGWESDLYAFDLEYGQVGDRQRQAWVLRLYPGDSTGNKAAHEFNSMRRLRQAGYPVPLVLTYERDGSLLGSPFLIMEKIDGQEMWTRLSNASRETRMALLSQFCQLFVDLHALDWRVFTEDTSPEGNPYLFIDRWIREAYENIEHSPYYSEFAPLVDWVHTRRDDLACPRPAPIHNDFHPNNVMLRPDGSAVVIDWTGFSISDPRFDLSWALLLASAYEGDMMRDSILHEYERLAGALVRHVECFEVCSCGRRLFDIFVSLSEGAERLGMRPEAVVAMKQQAGATQKVYDLLRMKTGLRFKLIEDLLQSLS